MPTTRNAWLKSGPKPDKSDRFDALPPRVEAHIFRNGVDEILTGSVVENPDRGDIYRQIAHALRVPEPTIMGYRLIGTYGVLPWEYRTSCVKS